MASSPAKLPTWYRVLTSVVGLMCIVSAIIVLVFPVLAVWLLIFLLALGLLFIGMDRLVAGISGHPFWWMGPNVPANPNPPAAPSSTTAPKP